MFQYKNRIVKDDDYVSKCVPCNREGDAFVIQRRPMVHTNKINSTATIAGEATTA